MRPSARDRLRLQDLDPELGTLRAPSPPVAILTSNCTREIHDALKRRCLYHWIDYPDAARELAGASSPTWCSSSAVTAIARASRDGRRSRALTEPDAWTANVPTRRQADRGPLCQAHRQRAGCEVLTKALLWRSATRMPKRTNDFQRLIGVIQSHLDSGAKVEEPALLPDRITGAKREVDIVVRGSVGGQPVVISIECRDRAKVDHVGWVEEMHGKHLRLATNVLVLASHSGFSKEAIKVADVYGIRCFILDDVDPSSPDRLFPDTQSLWGKTWTVTIDRVEITVEASGSLPREVLNAYLGMGIFLADRTPLASVGELAEALSRDRSIVERAAAEIRPEHTFMTFGWADALFGQRLYIEKREPLGLRPIERFNVIAHVSATVHEFPLQYGKYGSMHVAWAKGIMLDKATMLVATKDDHGQTRLTMKELDTTEST